MLSIVIETSDFFLPHSPLIFFEVFKICRSFLFKTPENAIYKKSIEKISVKGHIKFYEFYLGG